MALHPPGHRRAHGAHMHRILAERLLGPAPAGMAQQIHAHPAEQVGPEGAGLPPHGLPDALLQVHVPAGAAGDGRGKGGGAPLEGHPAGTIDEVQAPDPQAGYDAGRPGAAVGAVVEGDVRHATPEGGVAVEHGELLGQAEPLQQGLGLLLQRASGFGRVHSFRLGVEGRPFVA